MGAGSLLPEFSEVRTGFVSERYLCDCVFWGEKLYETKKNGRYHAGSAVPALAVDVCSRAGHEGSLDLEHLHTEEGDIGGRAIVLDRYVDIHVIRRIGSEVLGRMGEVDKQTNAGLFKGVYSLLGRIGPKP